MKAATEKLLALGTLLSSVLIYNQVGKPDKDMLDTFEPVTHLLTLIKKD
jgi:hypothetical protein